MKMQAAAGRGGWRGGRGLLGGLALLLMCSSLLSTSWAYDVDMAHTMLDYAASAYFCRTPACSFWNCTSCQKHPDAQVVRIHDDGHNGNGLLALDPKLGAIVVAFAGTDSRSIPNWIDDINVLFTKYPDPNCDGCAVHLGFWETYQAIRDQFLLAFQAARDKAPGAAVWVTGHSLGAALAVHAVMDLLKMEVPVEHLLNFGQPRVGNQEFASFCADVFGAWGVTHYRITHAHDPVPHLPPMMFGFHHQPNEVWYPAEEAKGYTVCDDSGEDKECSNRYYVTASISDHMIYLDLDLGKSEEYGWELSAALMLQGGGDGDGGVVPPPSPFVKGSNATLDPSLLSGRVSDGVSLLKAKDTMLRGYIAKE